MDVDANSSRMAATGGTFAARRAGAYADSTVTPVPTTSTTRTDCDGEAPGRRTAGRCPGRRAARCRPYGQPDAAGETERAADHADDRGLQQYRAADLLAVGTDRPQQRKLAQPLGDEHRERVVDDERADDEGDHAERPAGCRSRTTARSVTWAWMSARTWSPVRAWRSLGRIAAIRSVSVCCDTPGCGGDVDRVDVRAVGEQCQRLRLGEEHADVAAGLCVECCRCR